MKKLTRKDYEDMLMPPAITRKKKRKRLKGGGKNKIVEVFSKRSPFLIHYPVISLLGSDKIRQELRNAIIQKLDEDEMEGVEELIGNFLENRLPVNIDTLRVLEPERKYLYKFLRQRDMAKRKKILKQRGGAIQALIPIAASALAPVITSMFGKLFG